MCVHNMYLHVLMMMMIIIILLHYQHGYSCLSLSLATPSYCPLLSAVPQGYIPYQHRAAVCRFELDVLPLLVHVKGSTGVHHSRAQCSACLVRLVLIVFVMCDRWPYSCCFVGCCILDFIYINVCVYVCAYIISD